MATIKKDEKKEVAAPSALQAQVNEIAATVRRLVKRAEQHWGVDLDNDGKVGSVRVSMLIVLLMAGLAMAANELVWKVGDSAYIDAEGDATFNSVTASLTGAVTGGVTGDVTGGLTETVTAANWTDGSTNTLALGINLISGTGGANDTTNTVVLANPGTAGKVCTIIMAAGTTNLITIADSGNVAATGAILLDANDSVTLKAATAALWVETSSTDN